MNDKKKTNGSIPTAAAAKKTPRRSFSKLEAQKIEIEKRLSEMVAELKNAESHLATVDDPAAKIALDTIYTALVIASGGDLMEWYRGKMGI